MKKEYFLIFVVILILVIAIFLRITQPYNLHKSNINQVESTGSDVAKDFIEEPQVVSGVNEDLVKELEIYSPQPGAAISSPLEIKGQARGFWFFEASLPVKLVDEAGNVIIQYYAQAQSDWMTTELVPFTASINFTTEANQGFLIISKDNPSGLPEHDAEIKIPVKYNQYE